jgi:nitroimidazol reductase NimA-like FMN-containing flavoprotein (pyridoxamine 5'-phosphate oxidase superfamily)
MAVSVRMSREEMWAMLTDSHTGILTTLRRDGVPIALPVWYCVLDGHVYVRTPARSKKVIRWRHDPRISFLVESGERWAELRSVHLTGRAVEVEDPEMLARVDAGLAEKYAAFRTERSDMPEATRAHYSTAFVCIRIDHDERILNWDNNKLGL